MDRFYTSPELFLELKALNIGACVINFYIIKRIIKGNSSMEETIWYDKGPEIKDPFVIKW